MTMTEEVIATPEPWVPSDETFGARLALIRNHLGGWNVSKTATLCAVDAQSWRSWEAGHHPRDYPAVCRRIADSTGCSLNWLMLGPVDPRDPRTRWYEGLAAWEPDPWKPDRDQLALFDHELEVMASGGPRCDHLVRT